ncbi:MAG: phosphate regulon sensor histidine kinase PhoR [Candidatus Obscuribacterales bacterium]|nr:phosphate regulon sensor histidine kinase PhoR [Steroidobacteraceae bacterium]
MATRAIWSFLAWVFFAVIVGLAFDRVGTCLAIVLGGYAVLQLYRLIRVESWLQRMATRVAPDYEGLWGEVLAKVSAIERRKEFHKQRNVLMLREFRRLTTAMPDGAVLLNSENEILWFNRHAGERLKLKRKRDFGMRIENLVRHPLFVEYLQSGEFSEPVSFQMPGTLGSWLSLYLVTTRAAPQRLLIVRDVTRQVQLEQMRKDFVANASHELRSPLTVVSGYLDALGEEPSLSPSWQAPVAEMRRQTERMRTLIDDLLELSRLEQRLESPGDEVVDVAGMLSMLRKDVQAFHQRPGAVELHLDSNAGIRGAERELYSVFANILGNAVKYTAPHGEIQIRWWVDDKGGHVAVRDSGIGIAPEHVPRLTERFYRVDAGRSREMGGSGLGLAIVKHALQRHDARLEVQSELGRGSTFTCHFPSRRIVQG